MDNGSFPAERALRIANAGLVVLVIALVATAWRASPATGQGPVVDRSTLWIDAVRRGELAIEVRGPGRLEEDGTGGLEASLRIPESQSFELRIDQPAVVDVGDRTVEGRVAGLASRIENGVLRVEVELTGELPMGARPGLNVDGRVRIRQLEDVLYVGKPAYARRASRLAVFKLVSDDDAERVPVEFGAASVNVIEVVAGLAEGDRIILSDMSRYDSVGRVRLR